MFHYSQEELKFRKVQLVYIFFQLRPQSQIFLNSSLSHIIFYPSAKSCCLYLQSMCQWGSFLLKCTKFILVQATMTSCLSCHGDLHANLVFSDTSPHGSRSKHLKTRTHRGLVVQMLVCVHIWSHTNKGKQRQVLCVLTWRQLPPPPLFSAS